MRNPISRCLLLALSVISLALTQPANADGLPYEAAAKISIYNVLAPYPKPGTPAGNADAIGVFSWLAKPGSVEWQEAGDDAAVTDSAGMLNYFTAGILDNYIADNAPATLKLLDRVRASLRPLIDTAKDNFSRPRPFRALKLAATCDSRYGPQAGADVGAHDSYPSGHSTQAWAAAQLLIMLVPDHARDWLARGQEFGESRVACGVHYPSDVAAGRLLALVTIDALKEDEAFRIDLGAAQLEYQRLRQQASR